MKGTSKWSLPHCPSPQTPISVSYTGVRIWISAGSSRGNCGRPTRVGRNDPCDDDQAVPRFVCTVKDARLRERRQNAVQGGIRPLQGSAAHRIGPGYGETGRGGIHEMQSSPQTGLFAGITSLPLPSHSHVSGDAKKDSGATTDGFGTGLFDATPTGWSRYCAR